MLINALPPHILAQASTAAAAINTPIAEPQPLSSVLRAGGLTQFYGFIPTVKKGLLGFGSADGLSNEDGEYRSIGANDLATLLKDSNKPTLVAFGFGECSAFCTLSNPNFASVRDKVNIVVINTFPETLQTNITGGFSAEDADGHRHAVRSVIANENDRENYAPIILYAQAKAPNTPDNLGLLSHNTVRDAQLEIFNHLKERAFLAAGDQGHSTVGLLFDTDGNFARLINDTTKPLQLQEGVNNLQTRHSTSEVRATQR